MGISRKAILSCLGLGLFLSVAAFSSREAAATVFIDTKHKHRPYATAAEPRETATSTGLSQDLQGKPGSNIGSLQGRITARSAIVIDGSTGEILYATSPDQTGQPASTIKILTGMIAINSLGNKDRVTVSQRAAGMPRSKVYLQAGKTYIADDLINAVLLSSANDASVALAEKIGGSETVFASLMTHTARRLGAGSTVCRTASGLTAEGQQTTARDLATIFNEVMRNSEFAERIRKTSVKTSYGGELRNHNRALWQVSGAEGGKTGYTKAARQTYVGKFRRSNDELVVALMGSSTMWDDVSTLVEHGFSRKRQLATARQQYSSEVVHLGQVAQAKRSPLLVVLTDNKKISSM